MNIALFQYSISKNQNNNHQKIKNALLEASKNNAKIFVTQECALSGYPPIEINSVNDIDFDAQKKIIAEIVAIAKEKNIYVFLGLIRKEKDAFKNSILIISPDGSTENYDKRALWGWDKENYKAGTNKNGIIEIDGIKIGVRICFEIRFPEYFRELYKNSVDIAIVSFCDVSQKSDPYRLNNIKSHLLTRAVENAFTIISVNSTTLHQTSPTCVIDPDGKTLFEAELNREYIIYYNYEKPAADFGRQGRIHYSNQLVGM